MASTILYKFRSSTNFESISMPGSSARLFDVKRAIVKAKKLDRSNGGGMQLEFDLSVKNAMTNEEYDDESMLLPRGTRVIVQRLPAAKGQGLLARIARADAGISNAGVVKYGNVAAADRGFYTIESTHNDEDEFVDANINQSQNNANNVNVNVAGNGNTVTKEEDELAALKAVTDQAGSMYGSKTSISRSTQPNKFAPPSSATVSSILPLAGGASGASGGSAAPAFHKPPTHQSYHSRPNADPELREQEKNLALQQQPKKRATGIPRTFLNIPAPTGISTGGVENGEGGGAGVEGITLQPNQIGFQALIDRGGGQSKSSGEGKRRDLDYALKLTASEIPEHLQCGICAQVVKNAMLIPWDSEGRTACEICMRDGLAKNAFRCPLTGQDSVSPDDLLPNVGLRKATDLFVKGVMEKMDEIILQQEADEEQEREKMAAEEQAMKKQKLSENFEGDGLDEGLILSKKGMNQKQGRKAAEDDFEFGGDVFDVEEDEENEEEANEKSNHEGGANSKQSNGEGMTSKTDDAVEASAKSNSGNNSNKDSADELEKKEEIVSGDTTEKVTTNAQSQSNAISSAVSNTTVNVNSSGQNNVHGNSSSGNNHEQFGSTKHSDDADSTGPGHSVSSGPSRQELLKNRAPPAGYVMGPAGASAATPSHPQGGRGYGNSYKSHHGRGGSHYQGGRGRFNQGYQGRGYHSGRGGGRFGPQSWDGGQGGYKNGKDQHQNFNNSGEDRSQKRSHSEIDDTRNDSFEGHPGGHAQQRNHNQYGGWHKGGRGDYGRGRGFGRFGGGGRGRGDFYGGRGRSYGRGRGWDNNNNNNNFGGRGRYGGRGRF